MLSWHRGGLTGVGIVSIPALMTAVSPASDAEEEEAWREVGPLDAFPVGEVKEATVPSSTSAGRSPRGHRGCTSGGPILSDLSEQVYVGSQLPNTPDHLSEWIQNQQRFAPGTTMPGFGVTEPEARNIAAYLHRKT